LTPLLRGGEREEGEGGVSRRVQVAEEQGAVWLLINSGKYAYKGL